MPEWPGGCFRAVRTAQRHKNMFLTSPCQNLCLPTKVLLEKPANYFRVHVFLVQVGSSSLVARAFSSKLVQVGSCKFGGASFLAQVGSCKLARASLAARCLPQVGSCKFGGAINSRASWFVQVWLRDKAGNFTGRTRHNAVRKKKHKKKKRRPVAVARRFLRHAPPPAPGL